MIGADHAARLGEDQLDQARVLVELGGQGSRPLAGDHLGESPGASLGLRDNLLRDRDDEVVGELDPRRAGGLGDQLADPDPGRDLG